MMNMKPLKLKKVKISKIGNPHILFGGAAAQGGQNDYLPQTHPDNCRKDTKNNGDCPSQTNGTTNTLGNVTDVNATPATEDFKIKK